MNLRNQCSKLFGIIEIAGKKDHATDDRLSSHARSSSSSAEPFRSIINGPSNTSLIPDFHDSAERYELIQLQNVGIAHPYATQRRGLTQSVGVGCSVDIDVTSHSVH